MWIGLLRTACECGVGSRTPSTSSSTASRPGTTATQNTARKSPAHSHIRPTASSGPAKAPTVSSDWRRPKAAPSTQMPAGKRGRGAAGVCSC